MKSRKLLPVDSAAHELGIERTAYGGLAFFGSELPEFREMCDFIKKSQETAVIENMPDAGNNLLETMANDFDKFSRMIRVSNSDDQIYYKTPILSHIDPNKFVAAYLALSPEYRRKLPGILDRRYGVEWVLPKLLEEMDWLIAVKEILESILDSRAGKVSGYVIRAFVDTYLTKFITQLREAGAKKEALNATKQE